MLDGHPLIAFATTAQPAQALAFYRDVLGLPLVADEHFALVFDAHGTMLRIAKMNDFTPRPGTVVGWQVDDIRAMVAALMIMGVTFERYPGMPQDEWGIMTFPERSKVAWFKDPDGNTLSLTQFPQAITP